MNTIEPLDPEDIADPQSVAFTGSDGHQWRGQPLKPFSARRFAAAQSLGLRLFNARPSEDGNGVYDGMLMDAAIVVYLCLAAESEVLRAARKPEPVFAAVLNWLDAERVLPGSKAFEELNHLFAAIMEEVFASTGEPAEELPSGGPEGNV